MSSAPAVLDTRLRVEMLDFERRLLATVATWLVVVREQRDRATVALADVPHGDGRALAAYRAAVDLHGDLVRMVVRSERRIRELGEVIGEAAGYIINEGKVSISSQEHPIVERRRREGNVTPWR